VFHHFRRSNRSTVGYRAPVVGRRGPRRESLGDVIRPWITLEAWERVHPRNGRPTAATPDSLQTQIQNDFTIRPPLRWNEDVTQPANVHDVVCLLVRATTFYKRHVMTFRRVASALLPPEMGTRPGPEFRIPVVRRIAQALNEYDVQQMLGTGYRTPLRILFETAYAGLQKLRPGERAMLFAMLTEAVGIPCAYLIEQRGAGDLRMVVLCKVNPGDGSNPADLMVYDPMTSKVAPWQPDASTTNRWLYLLDEDFNIPANQVDAGSCVARTRDVTIVPGQIGQVPPQLLEVMHGRGLMAAPEWRKPATTLVSPEWYQRVIEANQNFDPNEIHSPFLVNPSRIARGPGTWTAENLGPETTGGIIAFMARIYSTLYADIFRDLVQWVWSTADGQTWFSNLPPFAKAYHARMNRAPVEEVIIDVANDGPAALGYVFGEWVRRALPYCEETIAVEEITGPLAALRLIAHYPGIQKFDCDDVSVFWMTGMESVVVTASQLAASRGQQAVPQVMTAVRLAGDPPVGADKYHVYPLISYSGVTRVFDVSNPLEVPLDDELEHGGNEETRWPQVPSTWLGLFYSGVELHTPQAAAGVPVGYRVHGPGLRRRIY